MTTPTRIIKAPGGPRRRPAPAATRVLKAAQLEALTEAERIVSHAKREACAISEQLHREGETARSQALEQGHAEAAAILVAARQQAQQILEEARDDLTRLAVAIAEKLLDDELRQHPERVEQIVARCLQQVGEARRVVVRVNPDDAAAIQAAAARLQAQATVSVLQVEPDPRVGAGGCLIDTELGQVDGRLETRLRMILEALESGE